MTIIGLIAASLTTISFLPQAILTLKTKKTEGISLSMYLIFAIGITVWLIYGLIKKDLPLIIGNFITLIFVIPILIIKIKNGKIKGL